MNCRKELIKVLENLFLTNINPDELDIYLKQFEILSKAANNGFIYRRCRESWVKHECYVICQEMPVYDETVGKYLPIYDYGREWLNLEGRGKEENESNCIN